MRFIFKTSFNRRFNSPDRYHQAVVVPAQRRRARSPLGLVLGLGIGGLMTIPAAIAEPPYPPDNGGSRNPPGQACVAAPPSPGTPALIGRSQPVFVWDEALALIEVYDGNTDELLWDYQPDPTANQVAYAGPPLVPGQLYYWQTDTQVAEFQIAPSAQQGEIAVDLVELALALDDADGNSTDISLDDITMAWVEYFAEANLWYDAIAVLSEVAAPDSVSATYLQGLTAHLCDRESAEP